MKVKTFQIGLMCSNKILFPALGAVGIIKRAGTTDKLFAAAINVAIIVNITPARVDKDPIVQLNGIGSSIGNL